MSTERAILVSDSHLDGSQEELEQFLAFLHWSSSQAGYIILLGDIFSYFVGSANFWEPVHETVLDTLREIHSRGVRVIYLEGNRELFIKRGVSSFPGTIEEDQFTLTLGGLQICLTHGDIISALGLRYGIYRRLVHLPCLFSFLRALPPHGAKRGIRAAQRMLKLSLTSDTIPWNDILVFCRSQWREGRKLVVLGHFHNEARITTPRGEAVLLPPWCSTRRFALIHEGHLIFHQWPIS